MNSPELRQRACSARSDPRAAPRMQVQRADWCAVLV